MKAQENIIQDNIMDGKQAELELNIIKKMMEDSRRVVYEGSKQGTFWTIIMVPAILANYFMMIFNMGLRYTGLVWIGVVLIGIIGSIMIANKEKNISHTKTFAGKILAAIGIGVGGANVMFALASGVFGAFHPVYIVPVDSVVLGMAFYLVGVIQQLKTLKVFAYIWWAGAIFFFVFPSMHCLLFLALMLVGVVTFPRLEEKKKSNSNIK